MSNYLRNSFVFLAIIFISGLAYFFWNYSGKKKEIPQIEAFLRSIEKTKISSFDQRLISNEKKLKQFKKEIFAFYKGVKVVHSFMIYNHIVDCITFETQPALRNYSAKERAKHIKYYQKNFKYLQKTAEKKMATDQSGRKQICPIGSVAIKRKTIAEHAGQSRLLRLKSYPASNQANAGPAYATARFDASQVDVITGASADLSLEYNLPEVGKYPHKSRYSIGQLWLTRAFSYQGQQGLQTLELGWMHAPTGTGLPGADTGTPRAVPFIFSTDFSYHIGATFNTCYNYNCKYFIVLSRDIVLWAPFPESYYGTGYHGTPKQKYVHFQADLKNQNWAITIGSTQIGYFTPEQFGSAPVQLLKNGAKRFTMGGESGSSSDDGFFPMMGNGTLPGPFQAASIRNITFSLNGKSERQPVPIIEDCVTRPIFGLNFLVTNPNPAPNSANISYGGPGGAKEKLKPCTQVPLPPS